MIKKGYGKRKVMSVEPSPQSFERNAFRNSMNYSLTLDPKSRSRDTRLPSLWHFNPKSGESGRAE